MGPSNQNIDCAIKDYLTNQLFYQQYTFMVGFIVVAWFDMLIYIQTGIVLVQ